MVLPPPRPKHRNLSSFHLMSCILLLASTTTSTASASTYSSASPSPAPAAAADDDADSLTGSFQIASTYSSACPSLAPAADRHTDVGDAYSLARSFQIYSSHFSGGAREGSFFSFDDDQHHNSYHHSFSLFPDRAARTIDPALVHLTATLELSGPRSRLRARNHTLGALVSFVLDGYYSSTSLELCMVGTPSATTTELAADIVVLRLRVPNPASLADPFVTGTLEGSSNLGAIQLLAYDQGDDYEYGNSVRAATCSPPAAPPLQALGVGGDMPACAHLIDSLVTSYRLVAQDHPHGGGAPAKLPRRMHVNQMVCTADGAVRAYVVFSNDTETLGYGVGFIVGEEAAVAEGHWDTARGMLCLRACRVVPSIPPSTLAVGECGMRMSFWFPAVWTVRDRSVVAGMLWNTSRNRIIGDYAGPFSGVNVMSAFSIDDPEGYHRRNLSDVRYQYNDTMLGEAKKHYLTIKKEKKIRGSFPVPGNHDTYHDLSLRFYGGNASGSGDAYPVSIGSVMMSEDALAAADDNSFSRHAVVGAKHGRLLSVSYDIDIHHYAPRARACPPKKNVSYSRIPPVERQRISAEGVYDPERGILCLVGCREHNGSTDCRILVTAQFASLDGSNMEQGHGGGRGVISSLRDRSDPLFFEKMDIDVYGMYSWQLSAAVSRMDLESVMLVSSTTLSCVFAAAQILHTKRNPEAAPATSVTMLAVLAMGYLAPLLLNLETLFASRRSRYDFSSYSANNRGWLELNQVMMEVPTLLALVLHLRLLQLVFSGRRRSVADQSEPLVTSERTVLKICLPLYLVGAVVATIVHAINARAASVEDSLVVRVGREPATLWDDLVSYTGLILDGFLLPQVILNASSSGGDRSGVVRAISPWFYMGGTVIRMVPHVYDVLREQIYEPSIILSDVYASPRGDLFGVQWDFAILCGATLLASILFFQQMLRVGCVLLLPSQLRESGGYEMVSHI